MGYTIYFLPKITLSWTEPFGRKQSLSCSKRLFSEDLQFLIPSRQDHKDRRGYKIMGSIAGYSSIDHDQSDHFSPRVLVRYSRRRGPACGRPDSDHLPHRPPQAGNERPPVYPASGRRPLLLRDRTSSLSPSFYPTREVEGHFFISRNRI
jgi:hypothetical protein